MKSRNYRCRGGFRDFRLAIDNQVSSKPALGECMQGGFQDVCLAIDNQVSSKPALGECKYLGAMENGGDRHLSYWLFVRV
jgi:hypothetical protein